MLPNVACKALLSYSSYIFTVITGRVFTNFSFGVLKLNIFFMFLVVRG